MKSKIFRRVLKYALIWVVLSLPLILLIEKTESIVFIGIWVVLGLILVVTFFSEK
jgi:hypothetical protein